MRGTRCFFGRGCRRGVAAHPEHNYGGEEITQPGGATPFADGLQKAWRLVKTSRIKDPSVEPLLIIISDGEANVPLDSKNPVERELLSLARQLRSAQMHAVVIDVHYAKERKNNLKQLAGELGATYYHLQRLTSENITKIVHDKIQDFT